MSRKLTTAALGHYGDEKDGLWPDSGGTAERKDGERETEL